MGTTIHEPTSRAELEKWLSPPAPPAKPPVLMVLRGTSEQVKAFRLHALNAAQREERREVVWVKQTSLFTTDELTRFFGGDADALAVALSTRFKPIARVRSGNTGEWAAEEAFMRAELAP
jgi:hypothetical protein